MAQLRWEEVSIDTEWAEPRDATEFPTIPPSDKHHWYPNANSAEVQETQPQSNECILDIHELIYETERDPQT